MEPSNQTIIEDLILVGFSHDLQTCILLFILFLVMYLLNILGNSFLIVAVITSPKLHTPMYYFLCHLAFLDVCCPTFFVPKLLIDLFSSKRRISIIRCLTQTVFILFLGGIQCLLLAVMAYDRYIAICFPLYYTVIMRRRVCIYITVFMWSGGFIVSTVPMIVKPLVFCREHTLNHYLCEILILLEVACGDISDYRITILVMSFFALLTPFVFIVVTYICIIMSVLKIRSVRGRSKAFSTCASHLTVVLMYYVTIIISYMGQTKGFSHYLKYLSLVYAFVTPALNPLIYSLRNNEVKEAFRKILTTSSTIHEAAKVKHR